MMHVWTSCVKMHPHRICETPNVPVLLAQLQKRRQLEEARKVIHVRNEKGQSSGVPLLRRDAEVDSPLDQALINRSALILEQTCATRRLFRTEDGGLGIGLRALAVGDQLWLLAGYIMPIILRPRPDGRMTFVGECYVHGMMFGEQWEEDEEHVVDATLV